MPLWCIVCETRSIIPVTIGKNNIIFDLKVAIKNIKSNYFAKFDADDLTLWRVNITQHVLKNKNTSIKEFLNDKLENTDDTIEATFPDIEGSNVRVIVEIPVAGES